MIVSTRYLTYADPSIGIIDENLDLEELFADLPDDFDLDTASKAEFLTLPFFPSDDIDRIINFRNTLRERENLYDNLSNNLGLSSLQLAILDYLGRDAKYSVLKDISGKSRNGFIYNPDNGDIEHGKYYLKLGADFGENVTVNMLGERDAYEPRVLDLFSGNVKYTLRNGNLTLLSGDYRPGYGQGLVFSRYGRSYSSGTNITSSESSRYGNTSFEESRFLRGGFVSLRTGAITTQVWTSQRNLDASLNDSGEVEVIRDTGIHLSSESRGNLSEYINSVRIRLTQGDYLESSVSGTSMRYSPGLSKRAGEKYFHDPEGHHFGYISIDGKVEKGPATVFFEHAIMNGKSKAILAGTQIRGDRYRAGFLIRHYGAGYISPHAGAFSAFGKTSNEKGVYTSFQTDISRTIRLIATMDLARTLSRTYTDDMPFSRRRLNFMVQSRFKGMTGRISLRSTDDSGDAHGRWNTAVQLEKKPSKSAYTGWRSYVAWSDGSGNGGPFAESSILLHVKKIIFDMSVGVFDIPSYDARFYRYERNVIGRGMTLAVWGRGGTFLLMIRRGAFSGRYVYRNSDLMDASREISIQFDLSF